MLMGPEKQAVKYYLLREAADAAVLDTGERTWRSQAD